MGEWNDAYERLRDAKDSGKTTAEVEELTKAELDKLTRE